MAPHSLVGRPGPRPRNDRPAIVSTASPTDTAAMTASGATMFGSRYFAKIAKGPAPHTRAARTKPDERRLKTRPRDKRANSVQRTAATAMTMLRAPCPKAAATAMASTKEGNA